MHFVVVIIFLMKYQNYTEIIPNKEVNQTSLRNSTLHLSHIL